MQKCPALLLVESENVSLTHCV